MGRPRKEGKCPQHLPKDQKCNGCQRGRGCTGLPPVAIELYLATESTSEEQDIPLDDHSRSIQLFSPPGCEGLKLVLSSEQYLDLPGHLSQSLRFK